MLPSTVSMRSANGRAASAAFCARRSLEAATICMALVIFCVALVEAMRTRMSLSEAILSPPRRPDRHDPTASLSSIKSGHKREACLRANAPGQNVNQPNGRSSKRLGESLDHGLQLGGGIIAEIAGFADRVQNLDVLAAQQRQQAVLE